jgi:iron complex outermembrane receptor protein
MSTKIYDAYIFNGRYYDIVPTLKKLKEISLNRLKYDISRKLRRILLLLFLISNFAFSQEMDLVEFQVIGIRPTKSDPVTITTIESDSVRDVSNAGSDPFFTLSRKVPNMTVQSDNGSQYGYSYLRMRGMDQTRINFTLNGIPMNEMEDQGIYFSNMPGFYNSVSRMDIVRGVGLSKYGTSSVVGSVNMELKSILDREIIGQIGLGSFGTNSTYLEYSSGLLGKVAFSSSLNYLQTDGFRENSGSDGYNYFGQLGFFNKKNILKLYGFSGMSMNDLSYIPIDKESLNQNYRINFNSPNDRDRFGQNFAALNWINSTGSHIVFNSSIYFNNVNGYYNLDGYGKYGIVSYQGGGMSNMVWSKNRLSINTGINYNIYQREHNLSSLDTLRYSNFGNKEDVIAYSRFSYKANDYSLFADIQYRGVDFIYTDENGSKVNYGWDFINPKFGIKRIRDSNESWVSFGQTSREVTRSDLFDTNDNVYINGESMYSDYLGESNLNSPNLYQIFPNTIPEIITNIEVGNKFDITSRIDRFSMSYNFYHMDIRNERLIIGFDNIYGLPIRQIADRSHRYGLEIESEYSYRNWYFGINGSYLNAEIRGVGKSSFSPNFTMNNFVRYGNRVKIGLNGMYVGKMYLNNEEDDELSTSPYYISNFTCDIRVKNFSIGLLVNNILDQKYLLPGGVLTGNGFRLGQYYPGSTRNYFVNLKFNIS